MKKPTKEAFLVLFFLSKSGNMRNEVYMKKKNEQTIK